MKPEIEDWEGAGYAHFSYGGGNRTDVSGRGVLGYQKDAKYNSMEMFIAVF